jgi:hypothetical protein
MAAIKSAYRPKIISAAYSFIGGFAMTRINARDINARPFLRARAYMDALALSSNIRRAGISVAPIKLFRAQLFVI